MASPGPENIERLIRKLSSKTPSTAKKALATITKLTRNSENVTRLRLKGGISLLLEFIQQPNRSHVDMALSALANCALDEECRNEIRRLDGIRLIVDVLKILQVTSILNRAARALANLAEDERSVVVMDELDVVSELAKALRNGTDSDCQETLLRALRKLCTTPSKKQIVLDLDCLKIIIDLLKSEKASVVNNCIRTLVEFIKNCSKELAQQVQEYDGIKGIVKLVSSNRSVVRHAAVLSLAHLACHSHVRICIGEEGGIQALHSQLQADEPGHVTSKAIEGLCYCCREAINRNRVRECGALTSLLQLLSSGAYPQLHRKIVSAFTWFMYNEPCLEVMLNGGLVPLLVSYLKSVISDESGCDGHDDHCCDELNLSSTSDISSPNASLVEGSSMLSDLKDAMTVEDNSNETLEKLEDLARQMKDTNESSSRSFKRKLRMKSAHLLRGVPNVGYSAGFSDAQNPTETSSSDAKIDDTNVCISETHNCPIPCDLEDQDTDDQHVQTSTHPLLLPCSTPQAGSPSSGRKTKSSSPVMSNSDFVLYPWFHHRRSRGHCALLLLSRISQMADPSDVLVTEPCIQVLLDYLTLVSEPSPKCARLLNRLTTNPSCFEALIAKGVSSQIHTQLCLGYHEKHPDLPLTCPAQGETSTASDSSNIPLEERCDECLSHQQPEGESDANSCKQDDDVFKDAKEMDCAAPWTLEKTTAEISVGLSSPDKEDIFQHGSSLRSYCNKFGHQLLENLASQAQTPFGKGILTHLLLRGSEEERQGCLLSLPHICRNKRLRGEMLIERKGVRLLCDMLKGSLTEEMHVALVDSLSVLAEGLTLVPSSSRTLQMKGDVNLPDCTHVGPSYRTGIMREALGVKHIKVEPVSVEDTTSIEPAAVDQLLRSDVPSCCYTDAVAHRSFDIHFKMDSGELIGAHREVLTATTDVFSAMLSECFVEATQTEVVLPEMSSEVFTFTLHCAYGCQTSMCGTMMNILKKFGTASGKCDFLFKLLAGADRFLFDKLKVLCEQLLVPAMQSSGDAITFCILGMHFHSSLLSEVGLRYLLSSRSGPLIRRQAFQKILSSKEKLLIVDQLCEVLVSHVMEDI